MAELTEREKELAEAVITFMFPGPGISGDKFSARRKRVLDALASYDPPKTKVYTMPPWEDFIPFQGKCFVGPVRVDRQQYDDIREALAKDSE